MISRDINNLNRYFTVHVFVVSWLSEKFGNSNLGKTFPWLIVPGFGQSITARKFWQQELWGADHITRNIVVVKSTIWGILASVPKSARMYFYLKKTPIR